MTTDFPDFDEFFSVLTEHDPYPWQRRLADAAVLGDWPAAVDVPTGMGKTMVIPIAVYAAAYQAHHGLPRTTPQRIIHVVNRRSVVTQTYAAMMQRLTNDRLAAVASACRALAGGWVGETPDEPLVPVQQIHGEAADSGEWLRPTGITVVSMTPHQLVSRLLFRGFGVSARTRSLHAGLLGIDALLLFDEPHLAPQAVETTRRVFELQAAAGQPDGPDGAAVGVPQSRLVLLGATIGPDAAPADHGATGTMGADDWAEDVPAVRAHRPLRLMSAKTGDAAVSTALVRSFQEQMKHGPHRRIAVVVNSIDMAQHVFAAIRALPDIESFPSEPRLITSAFRQVDRSIRAARDGTVAQPQLVVATQCIEVGVDWSFDAVITEACPYSSLVQRVGRLNRDGTADHPQGVVVIGDDAMVRKATSAIYGQDCVAATNAHLRSLAVDANLPFDIASQRAYGKPPDAVWPPQPRLATLTANHLETLATTYPTPFSDVPVEAFIAGPDDATSLNVQVGWRTDLDALQWCPPLPGELLSVPVAAVRALLTDVPAPAMSDIDVETGGDAPSGAGRVGRQVAEARVKREPERRLRGGGRPERSSGGWVRLTDIDELRPGDLVIIEANRGGYDPRTGWSPRSRVPVPDSSIIAALDFWERNHAPHQRPVSFQISADTVSAWAATHYPPVQDSPEAMADLRRSVDRLVARAAVLDTDETLRALAELLPSLPVERLELLVVNVDDRYRLFAFQRRGDNNSETAVRGLDRHQRLTEDIAQSACRASGVDQQLATTVAMSARYHDEGKRALHFQRFLGNPNVTGDEGMAVELWAKSKRGKANRTVEHRWAATVGHPLGWRHEGLGAQLLHARGFDELAVHLVGAHHGRFRPLLLSLTDGEGQDEMEGRAEQFARLNARWGPWGLAYLEAIVRLADWRASALPASEVKVPAEQPGRRAPATQEREPVRRSGSDVVREVVLTGLEPTPVIGWYSLLGLLRIAREMGDESAAVRWPYRSQRPPSAPIWRSTTPLHEVCQEAIETGDWKEFIDLSISGDDGKLVDLQGKNQTIPAASLHDVIRGVDNHWLITAVLQDCFPKDGNGNVPLTMPARANNASYVKTAVVARANPEASELLTAALSDSSVGSAEIKADGGLDRPLNDDGITGRELVEHRKVRTALAPAALLGMASMGAAGKDGPGVNQRREMRLPLPESFTTWHGLAAYTRAAARWHGWVLAYRAKTLSRTDILWLGRPIFVN